jgi:hypothetical protein
MKHLKRFNESFEQQMAREELQDFCETHLAYLLDEGYEIYVKEDRDSLLFALTIPSDISTEEDPDACEFKWNDIKDHFIPFLIHLNNNYEINGKSQFFTNTPHLTYQYYTIQQMIDDKPSELDCYLYEIEMSIK